MAVSQLNYRVTIHNGKNLLLANIWMFRHPAWAAGGYRSGLPPAQTKSTVVVNRNGRGLDWLVYFGRNVSAETRAAQAFRFRFRLTTTSMPVQTWQHELVRTDTILWC